MYRKALAAFVIALVAALAVGCGGDDDDGGGGGGAGEETQTLTVGVIPIVDVAPLYLGIEQGFFEEENLRIEPKFSQGGAVIVPEVISGDVDIGFSNTVSLIVAAGQGLPVKIITQGDQAGGSSGLSVLEDSDIRDLEDLEGKRIAVNTLRNVATLTMNRILEEAGVDFETVEYVELPFPEMQPALEQGDVDAAVTVEPFTTLLEQAGARKIAVPFEQTADQLTVAPYFATEQFINENEDVVERFIRAMNRSLEYAQANEDEVRAIVPTYTEVEEDLAQRIALPFWSASLNRESIQLQTDLAERYGYIDNKPALDDLISELAQED